MGESAVNFEGSSIGAGYPASRWLGYAASGIFRYLASIDFANLGDEASNPEPS